MASYIMPEGEPVLKGWSRRRDAALARKSIVKDAFAINAVRGAHIAVERINHALLDAKPDARAALEEQLALAKAGLASAEAALEAAERGEEPEEEEVEDGDGGETEEDAPASRPAPKGRRGARR